MIAELGLAALWLAAALAALQMIAGFMAVRSDGQTDLARLIRPAAIVQGALVTFSFAMLVWLFAITDLSVKLVASNSHSMKPSSMRKTRQATVEPMPPFAKRVRKSLLRRKLPRNQWRKLPRRPFRKRRLPLLPRQKRRKSLPLRRSRHLRLIRAKTL